MSISSSSKSFKIFFATDLHGSTTCFKKFIAAKKFYKADYLILGGDLSGKKIVIIQKTLAGWYINSNNFKYLIDSESELKEHIKRYENEGIYYSIENSDYPQKYTEIQIEEIYKKKVIERMEEWMKYAENKLEDTDKILAIAGNDDIFEIDEIIKNCKKAMLIDKHWYNINNQFIIAGYSYTTKTPWDTAREKSEAAIKEDLLNINPPNSSLPLILNFHIPPKGILDTATELDSEFKPVISSGGIKTIKVGSEAVYQYIDRHRPALGLFGHVHEARGITKLGSTLCINPGSISYTGKLQGCICTFNNDRLSSWQLTEG